MFNKLIDNMETKWLEGTGPHTDVVISSRIRLARNLRDMPFPHLMQEKHNEILNEKINNAVENLVFPKEFGKLNYYLLKNFSNLERSILVEKRLISPEHIQIKNSGVIFNSNQSISIMVKEEDHLRIQAILPGFQVNECFNVANTVDDLLEQKLDYAFHEKYGYLTACPTNVGTGMRASVLMHLPGLVLNKQVNRTLTALSQVGVVVRGIYGEGTEPLGNLYQISNGTTIGRSEEEVVRHLSSVIKQIIDQERAAREILFNKNRIKMEDRVMRAKGVLENARLMSSAEALNLLSDLKLGIDLDIISNADIKTYYELLVATQPAYLQYTTKNKEMNSYERDIIRAEIIRERMKKINYES
jgi:protein arginine kinase